MRIFWQKKYNTRLPIQEKNVFLQIQKVANISLPNTLKQWKQTNQT